MTKGLAIIELDNTISVIGGRTGRTGVKNAYWQS